MRTSYLLNCLLIVALLFGSIGPLSAAPFSAPAPAALAAPETPTEPAATDAFAPYAHWQNSADAYVSVPHDDALSPQTGATFEAWIFASNLSGCRAIFGKDYQQGYWVGLCNGRIRYHSGGPTSNQDGVTAILPNVWTHIAVVWDPVFNVRRYFINGDFDYIGTAGPAPTGSRELRIGGDQPWDSFAGFMAEARIWNVARDQADIRRTMHSYVDEKVPGLVATWPFRTDYTDVIGGRVGTAVGTQQGINFVGTDNIHPFPLRPATVVADELFNSLPQRRYAAATAYIPNWDRALLIGGNVDGLVSDRIDAVDGGTGDLTALGTLPMPLLQPAAAYAPESNIVYVFGGNSGGAHQDAIYAVDPATGAVRTLAAKLPVAVSVPAAVYHPGLGKIFVLGGYGGTAEAPDGLNRVSVFDPATETLTPATFTLPGGIVQTAAIYASATQSIFYFGGTDAVGAPGNGIYQIQANGDGTTGSVTPLAGQLAAPDYGISGVEDTQSQLIYLLGSSVSDRVWAFDPVTGQLWQTPSQMPEVRSLSAALYSKANRHILLLGGFNGSGQANVWKFDLGDGPGVKLGHWDFESASGSVNSISGAADRVFIGTTTGASARSDGGTVFYGPGDLGGTNVRIIRNDPARGRLYFVVDTNRIVYDTGNSIIKLWPNTTETDKVLDFSPYGNSPVIATEVNLGVAQGYGTLLWRYGLGDFKSWYASWKGCYFSSALVNRTPNEIWGLVTDVTPCGPRSIGPEPRQAASYGDVYMQGLTYNSVSGAFSEFDYGKICVDGVFVPNQMAFGKNGDFWAAGSTGVCRYPAATIPGTFGVEWKYNVMNTPTGSGTNGLTVDADGRVWFGVRNDASHSGGLTVFEVLGKNPNRQSIWTTDYTWLNAPIGSKNASGAADYDSSVSAVYANGERVWSARGSQIYTIAQRWQQLDERNSLEDKAITGIWTVRGRLFVASADELFVLQPDGTTWESWVIAGVKAVVADKRGQIWVGGADGVQRYTSVGFTPLPSPTAPPAGPITALAVDKAGRVWIGGAAGVTLYDRDRFVTTLTPATGGVVYSLRVDLSDNVWVGTDAGLNRFAPGDATWTAFTTADGLPSNDIGDIALLRDGTLAISAGSALVQYRGGTTFVGYSISGNKLPLTVDDKGRLWAGGSVVDGNAWQNFTWANSGLRANAVIDNAADGADRVWFAHPNGGLSVRGSTLPPLSEQVPLISGINPTSGSAGNDIHILGSGFGTDRYALDVTIGGKPVEIIAATDTDVTVRLGPDNTSGRVSLLKNRKRRTSASDLFCAIPVIKGVTPSGGNVGVEMTVTGTNFDPGAVITLGGGSHTPYPADTKTLVTRIEPGDATGFAKVINNCGDSWSWIVPFNKIDLSVSRLVLNQGIPDQPLVYAKPTFIQSYLRRSVDARNTDKLEISLIEVTFTDPRNNASVTYTRPYTGAVPTSGNSSPSGALLADIVNSVNVWNIGPIGGTGFVSGNLKVDVALRNHGRTVAATSQSVYFGRNVPLRVVLVPIMQEGYSADELNKMKTNTDRNLLEMSRRIMPTGNVEFIWSNDVHTNDESMSLDNFFVLYKWAPRLDRARSRWNDRSNSDALIAFGVVDPRIVGGNADGYGLWPDASEMANLLALNVLDTICDAANTALEIVSFGFLGSDDGCHLDIPLYIGWAKGDDGNGAKDTNGMVKLQQSSFLFAHEIGHTLNMVKPWAANGSLDDNLSHSINDEIGPLGDFDDPSYSCTDWGKGGVFDWGLSLYKQPGVRNPVVNPMTGVQLRPQNDGNAWTPRAKAMMSYACAKYNGNTFFEPVDAAMIRGTIGGGTLAGAGTLAAQQMTLPVGRIAPRDLPGPRLHVAGTVAQDGQSGEITRVETLGESAPLGLPFNTGYWLVQVDGAGGELNRLGVYPVFETIHKHEDPEPQPVNTTGFFATTLLKADGMAAIQLRHDDTVLATFAPGSATPVINISSPTGGTFSDGAIPVAWTATDDDGDPLEIAVDYSPDGGVTWTSVASLEGSGPGTTALPVGALAGSDDARIRVTASDGLRTASATSPAFVVTAQPPRPFISAPMSETLLIEGQIVEMSGGAGDNQDGYVDTANLRWRSDRDGDLGSGAERSVGLSVGTHLLTLAATNSAGLTAETSLTVTVQGDYDGDTILDTMEAADGLNPLTSYDAYSDADGDGLPLVMERNWGTNPALADSDGDERNDDEEIGAGTDPTVNDAPLAADSLRVSPKVGLTFAADLSLDTAPAQERVQVVSRESAPWTMSFDVPWLATSAAEGMTPSAPTILVRPAGLSDGVHTGNLIVNGGALGQVTLPVTVTISNKASYCDTDQNGVTDQADVDGVSALLGSQDGDENYNYHYDLNRDGVIDSQDVALITACVTGSAPTYRLYLPATSRETVSAPSTLLVYGDGLASGWADWSWNSTVDFASTGQVRVGTTSIAIIHNAGNVGFSLRTATPLDGSKYSAIRFWIYGNGKPLVLYTQSSDDGGISPFYRFTPPAGVWARYSAPLNTLSNPTTIARINIQDESGAAQPVYYVDELEVVAKP